MYLFHQKKKKKKKKRENILKRETLFIQKFRTQKKKKKNNLKTYFTSSHHPYFDIDDSIHTSNPSSTKEIVSLPRYFIATRFNKGTVVIF